MPLQEPSKDQMEERAEAREGKRDLKGKEDVADCHYRLEGKVTSECVAFETSQSEDKKERKKKTRLLSCQD